MAAVKRERTPNGRVALVKAGSGKMRCGLKESIFCGLSIDLKKDVFYYFLPFWWKLWGIRLSAKFMPGRPLYQTGAGLSLWQLALVFLLELRPFTGSKRLKTEKTQLGG